MKKVYIAGSLFKQGDIKQRLYEEQYILRKSHRSWSIYNPINAPINNKSTLPSAQDIFLADFKQILNSDTILAALDDIDPGLYTELGICYGINYMLEQIKTLAHKYKITERHIKNFLKQFKPKTIYAHLSDIRIPTAHEYKGLHIPYGYNQFVIGLIEKNGKIYHSVEDAIDEMIDDQKDNN